MAVTIDNNLINQVLSGNTQSASRANQTSQTSQATYVNQAGQTGSATNAAPSEDFRTVLTEELGEPVVSPTSGKVQGSNKVDLDAIFEKAAKTYDVPVNLLKAMAKAESNFNIYEVSSTGAKGIMQLMPSTAAALGVSDPFDPEQNIMGGAKYISQKIKQYNGNTTLALAAYQAGSGNVKKYGGVPPFKSTQTYIKNIYTYMNQNVSAGTATVKSSQAVTSAPVSNVATVSNATTPVSKMAAANVPTSSSSSLAKNSTTSINLSNASTLEQLTSLVNQLSASSLNSANDSSIALLDALKSITSANSESGDQLMDFYSSLAGTSYFDDYRRLQALSDSNEFGGYLGLINQYNKYNLLKITAALTDEDDSNG